jgi:hypothetical protein
MPDSEEKSVERIEWESELGETLERLEVGT